MKNIQKYVGEIVKVRNNLPKDYDMNSTSLPHPTAILDIILKSEITDE